MTDANKVPKDLRRFLDESGAEVSGSREIDHATQYRLRRGPDEATLNVYRTGKVLEGGKPSGLRDLLRDWRTARSSSGSGSGDETSKRAPASAAVPDGTPRLGVDEAGKGDYFGPLVVAGVRVTGREAAERLREIGVRDSKELSPGGAVRISAGIPDAVGTENVWVVSLTPPEYERRRTAAGNVNKLLVEVVSGIMDNLQKDVEVVVVDEFARTARRGLEPSVAAGVRLEVRARAEDDPAVAAASILARARYLEDLAALSEEVGFELPRGATHVRGAARRMLRERGMERLKAVAKVSFATTDQVQKSMENGR